MLKPKKDITGQIFGKLQVIKMAITSKSNGNEFRAICKCLLCGREDYDARPAWLKRSHSGSCGCDKSYFSRQTGKNSKLFKGHEELSSRFVSNAKRRAVKLDIDFDLDAKVLWNLYLKQDRCCALSGKKLKLATNSKRSEATASIDRIDSNLGYIATNVQWVHKDINLMKMNLSQHYFLDMCQLVAAYGKKKA